MLNKFKQYPEPLQRQIVMRLGTALGTVVLAGILAASYHDFSVVIVGVIIFAFCVGQAIWLYYLADNKKYVLITGTCQNSTLAPVTRRIKSVLLLVVVDNSLFALRHVHG